jgi:hypothetical protein
MSGRRSSAPPFPGRVRLDVVLGAEAAIDHAVVLRERVHARGPDEAVSLRLQLLGEGIGLGCRGGQVRQRPWRSLAGALVRPRERRKARRGGSHRGAFSTVAWISARLRMIAASVTSLAMSRSVIAGTVATSKEV